MRDSKKYVEREKTRERIQDAIDNLVRILSDRTDNVNMEYRLVNYLQSNADDILETLSSY